MRGKQNEESATRRWKRSSASFGSRSASGASKGQNYVKSAIRKRVGRVVLLSCDSQLVRPRKWCPESGQARWVSARHDKNSLASPLVVVVAFVLLLALARFLSRVARSLAHCRASPSGRAPAVTNNESIHSPLLAGRKKLILIKVQGAPITLVCLLHSLLAREGRGLYVA